MKKMQVFVALLVLAVSALGTVAFTHPLTSVNGVVTGFGKGSLTLHTAMGDRDYMMNSTTAFPASVTSGLGVGARVTVWAMCSGGHASAGLQAAHATNGNAVGAGGNAQSNVCSVVFVLIRAAANGAVPTTGGTGTATAAPGATMAPGTSTPAVPSGTATPMVTPTATP